MIQSIGIGPILIVGILTVIISLMGVFILIGKGDFLISGYNTASKEEKAKVNIKRLRFLSAIMCWIAAVYSMLIVLFLSNATMEIMLTAFFVIITVLFWVLANTWAKIK